MRLEMLRAKATQGEGRGFRSWDPMAVELESAEFLYGLVRALKPQIVLESGTGRGLCSTFIAQALSDNGNGWLHTYEPLESFARKARRRLRTLPATVHDGIATLYDGPSPDLVFLDSAGEGREDEIETWLDRPVALVVHDAYRYALEGGLLVPTPRGLWLRLPESRSEGQLAEY